jgi:hypothetical protein
MRDLIAVSRAAKARKANGRDNHAQEESTRVQREACDLMEALKDRFPNDSKELRLQRFLRAASNNPLLFDAFFGEGDGDYIEVAIS